MADDLPLLANVNDILVHHYNFKFCCDFDNNCFVCCVLLFLEPVTPCTKESCQCAQHSTASEHSPFHNLLKQADNYESVEDTFVLILDCHKIKVTNIFGLDLTKEAYEQLRFSKIDPSSVNVAEPLTFLTSDWALRVWSKNTKCRFCFPKVIQINYETTPSCPSLLWIKDQDKKKVVFTYGATVNNRSFFPCQEPPIAMATWEALVLVPNSYIVLMSGDDEPEISNYESETSFYYFTKKALPLSTLCLAIGQWENHVISQRYESSPKCRIFAPTSLIDLAIQELFEYVPYCLKISEDIFGSYPFSRIDFLIVPPTFGSLGMANPNVIFLSQSILVGDGSMCSRVFHEIAHGWFGLLIGALDWTEEWLSEGFATFVEDYLHVWTLNMNSMDAKDCIELRSFIRRKTFLDEIKNTAEELQVLSSSKGVEAKNMVDGIDATIIKNGQNPIKGFIQVHYIKGYFLLKYLSDTVGIDDFIGFLCQYIKKYSGKLVTSKEFLIMYLEFFPSVKNTITVDYVYENWLHNSNIPDIIENFKVSPENKLFKEVSDETKRWKKLNNIFLKNKSKRKKINLEDFISLSSEQIILLLENLLSFEVLSTQTLKYLIEVYKFKRLNPEIQHRWFELVVMHQYKSEYGALKQFLTDHVAMGVYLYSEMIYSTSQALQSIAKECYYSLEFELEPNFKATISQMLNDCSS